jgi:hypothetical protein
LSDYCEDSTSIGQEKRTLSDYSKDSTSIGQERTT